MPRKKLETTAFAIRLPLPALERLDDIAAAKFESRAGMASRIILEWLESQPAAKPASATRKTK